MLWSARVLSRFPLAAVGARTKFSIRSYIVRASSMDAARDKPGFTDPVGASSCAHFFLFKKPQRAAIFYVSDAFERSYEACDRKMGRPGHRGVVLAVWRGLVQHVSARDGGLVGVLPPVDNEETPGGVRTL